MNMNCYHEKGVNKARNDTTVFPKDTPGDPIFQFIPSTETDRKI